VEGAVAFPLSFEFEPEVDLVARLVGRNAADRKESPAAFIAMRPRSSGSRGRPQRRTLHVEIEQMSPPRVGDDQRVVEAPEVGGGNFDSAENGSRSRRRRPRDASSLSARTRARAAPLAELEDGPGGGRCAPPANAPAESERTAPLAT